jgi:RNA polymerase sigma-70 factor (family 1)
LCYRFALPQKPNDEILLAAIMADDQTAYRSVFEAYYDRLFRFALLITKSRELSEEIVSDVFMALWRNRHAASEIRNLKVYLYIAVRNTAYNYCRKMGRIQNVSLEELKIEVREPFANPEQVYVTKELNARISKAIEELPPRCKVVFKLVKEDGFTYREAAELLGLSVGTIDNQLVIAIKRISSSLFYRFTSSPKKKS